MAAFADFLVYTKFFRIFPKNGLRPECLSRLHSTRCYRSDPISIHIHHTSLSAMRYCSGLVWYLLDSNQWHPHLQCGALPTELRYLIYFTLQRYEFFFNYPNFFATFFLFYFLNKKSLTFYGQTSYHLLVFNLWQ